MSKANQKAINGPKLEPMEIQLLTHRNQVCQMKEHDVIRGQRELQMLQESASGYLHSLVMKYELDPLKRYSFNGTSIVEFQDPGKNPAVPVQTTLPEEPSDEPSEEPDENSAEKMNEEPSEEPVTPIPE